MRLKLISSIVLIVLVGCTPKYLAQDFIQKIVSKPDVATCVILNVEGNSNEFVPVYCDRKPVAGLKETSIAMFDVQPGPHYVIAESDNCSVFKIDFLPNKVYFFKMGTVETPVYDGVKLTLIKKEIAEQFMEIKKPEMKFLTLNPQKKSDDFDQDDFDKQVSDNTEWEKDNPKDAEDILNYKGYEIK
jgi:hypothetical protein